MTWATRFWTIATRTAAYRKLQALGPFRSGPGEKLLRLILYPLLLIPALLSRGRMSGQTILARYTRTGLRPA